jgi:hypothetical protein
MQIPNNNAIIHYQKCGPKGARAFRGAKVKVSIWKYAKVAKKFCSRVGPSAWELISLQKADSLLVFEGKRNLKRFMRLKIGDSREKPSKLRLNELIV